MSCKKKIWAILPLIIILLPDIVWVAVGQEALDAIRLGLVPALALLCGLVAWSGRRVGWVIAALIPFSVFVPIETYYIWNFQSPSSVHILGVVSETNLREAREYVGNVALIGLVVATVAVVVIFGVALRVVRFSIVFPAHRAWRWIGFAAILPLVGLLALECGVKFALKPVNDFVDHMAQDQFEQIHLVRDLSLGVNDVLSPSFPLGVPVRFRNYFVERQRLSDAQRMLETVKVVAATGKNAPSRSVVVLVIGESASASHWGVNGYSRNTTPEVSAMADAVSFRNLITPWHATRLAVPVILTGQQDSNNGLSPLSVPSVLAVFRAAGWKTYWLSNQSPLGMHDSSIALYAGSADVTRYFNAVDYSKAANFDDVLLEPLLRALKYDSAPRKLIVLHLLGSHARYHSRYPDDFDRFQPSGLDGERDDDEAVVNAYDNSILFTDHILGEIVGFLKKSPSDVDTALVYVSDHGQALPTSLCRQWGHSQISESTFRIPGMVWLSPESQRLRGKMAALRQLRDAPLHASEVFDTLLDLADIDYEGLNRAKSWVNPDWRPRRRLFKGNNDFDSIPVKGLCQVLTTAGS